jgi:hypothetical protein
LLVVATPTHATQQDDEQLQNRYRLCMDKADADNLEEFRASCDVLCLHQQNGTENACLARHTQWDTATCTLPTVELDRQERHLEQARDRCLKEFKAGITAPP